MGSIPGLETSPGEGKDYPLQYSGLENSMERSQTQLSDFHFLSKDTRTLKKNPPDLPREFCP